MKKISIGSWAYTIGPYEENPVPWDDVVHGLVNLGFDGVEIGGFGIHPNPDLQKTKEEREEVKAHCDAHGL